jgi:hypothetical protein
MTRRIGLGLLFVFGLVFGLSAQVCAMDNDPNDMPELFDSRYQTAVCGFTDLHENDTDSEPAE